MKLDILFGATQLIPMTHRLSRTNSKLLFSLFIRIVFLFLSLLFYLFSFPLSFDFSFFFPNQKCSWPRIYEDTEGKTDYSPQKIHSPSRQGMSAVKKIKKKFLARLMLK